MSSASAGSNLIGALQSLRASGADSFERLVCDLLSAQSGKQFRLPATGFQGGRDGSTGGSPGAVTAVECKRYGEKTNLDKKELVATLWEARRQTPRLDLWVLAASREVPDLIAAGLVEMGDELGVEVLVLDYRASSGGPLHALCAAHPALVESALQGLVEPAQLRSWLEAVAAEPSHEQSLRTLDERLRQPHLSHSGVAEELAKRFGAALRESHISKERLGQRILPLTAPAGHVVRSKVEAELKGWWHGWLKNRDILVVHGDHGTGKSWTLAEWLWRGPLSQETRPVLVWLSAQRFDFGDPVTTVVTHVRREFPERVAINEKRARAWPAVEATTPRVLVVLDGLNELPPRPDWQDWLIGARRSLADSPGLGLVVTTRTDFWQPISASLERDAGAGIRETWRPAFRAVGVPDFTEAELSEARARAGVATGALDPKLEQLLRKPRYFALAVRCWKRLLESGDFTPERLFLEERREWLESRRKQPVTAAEFSAFLVELARKAKDSPGMELSGGDLRKLAGGNELANNLDDLISVGVLERRAGVKARYRVSRDRLYVGLGLLVLDEACTAASNGLEAAIESVAQAFEPAGDIDDVAAIARNAVCAALLGRGHVPEDARVAILLALVLQRNVGDHWEKAAPWEYFPDNPCVFGRLAEEVWALNLNRPNHAARERVAFCFARAAAARPGYPALVDLAVTWASYVAPIPRSRWRAQAPGRGAREPEPEDVLAGRLSEANAAAAGCELGVVLNQVRGRALVDLVQLAFLVASFGPHEAFGRMVAAWALGRTAMRLPREIRDVSWWLRTASPATCEAIGEAARKLLSVGTPLAVEAGKLLLDVEGSRDSMGLWSESAQVPDGSGGGEAREPGEPLGMGEVRRLARLAIDPSVPITELEPEALAALLEEARVEDLGEEQLTFSGAVFEAAEPALCRVAHSDLSALSVGAALDQVGAFDSRRRGVPHRLSELHMLLSSEGIERLRAAHTSLDGEPIEPTGDQGEGRETEVELAEVILAHLEGEEQHRFFLGRHNETDLWVWDEILDPVGNPARQKQIAEMEGLPSAGRRRRLLLGWEGQAVLSERDREKIVEAAKSPECEDVACLPAIRARDGALLVESIRAGLFDDGRLSRLLASEAWARAALLDTTVDGLCLGAASQSQLLEARGISEAEVRAWARDLDGTFRLSDRARRVEGGGRVSVAVVSAALALRVPEAVGWADELAGSSGRFRLIATQSFGLVEALAVSLLTVNDQRGTAIVGAAADPSTFFRFRDPTTKIISAIFWPFKAGACNGATTEAIRCLWERALSDDAIQQLAFAASVLGRFAWLTEAAREVAARSRFDQARLVMLAGLSSGPDHRGGDLVNSAHDDESWVRHAVALAGVARQEDKWAQHWFDVFLRSPTRSEAWGAFRLFLRCVDRRWHLWGHQALAASSAPPDPAEAELRRRHLALNRGAVQNQVEQQSSARAKQLFGWDLPSFDMAPWKRTYRW